MVHRPKGLSLSRAQADYLLDLNDNLSESEIYQDYLREEIQDLQEMDAHDSDIEYLKMAQTGIPGELEAKIHKISTGQSKGPLHLSKQEIGVLEYMTAWDSQGASIWNDAKRERIADALHDKFAAARKG